MGVSVGDVHREVVLEVVLEVVFAPNPVADTREDRLIVRVKVLVVMLALKQWHRSVSSHD